MAPDRLVAALLAVAFPVVTAWLLLNAESERDASPSPQTRVIRFTKSWRVWWYVCIVIFALGFSSDLYLGKVKPDDRLYFWLTFVGFTTLFGLGTWYLIGYRVEYDAQELRIYWPAGRSRSILWANVLNAEFKKGTGIVVNVSIGKMQVIPSLLPGAYELLREANARAGRVA